MTVEITVDTGPDDDVRVWPQPVTHIYGCAQSLGGGLTCTYFVDPMTMTCPMGHSNDVQLCMEYWPSATGHCSHGHTQPEVCGKPMQPLGTEVPASAGPIEVPSSHDADYYQKPGHVLVYPVKDIPTPATVPWPSRARSRNTLNSLIN